MRLGRRLLSRLIGVHIVDGGSMSEVAGGGPHRFDDT